MRALRFFALSLVFVTGVQAFAFTECDKYMGGDGPEGRPDIWSSVASGQLLGGIFDTIQFFEALASRSSNDAIHLPYDVNVTPGPGGFLYYPNGNATRWILDILAFHRQGVRVDHRGGYLTGSHVTPAANGSLSIKLELAEARDGVANLDAYVRVPERLSDFYLSEPLLPQIKEAFTGTRGQAYRFMLQTRFPDVVAKLDRLNLEGQVTLPGDLLLRKKFFELLAIENQGTLPVRLEISQGRGHAMGQFMRAEEIAGGMILRLMKKDPHPYYQCAKRFHLYSRARSFGRHQDYERDEYLGLLFNCTDAIEVSSTEDLRIETW